MALLLPHTCNMCSYGARTIESLTSHVCRIHKNDPRFHIYCESCLRSYTKWDSYRKHVQRGCSIVSNGGTSTANSQPDSDQNDNGNESDIENQPHSPVASVAVEEDWHEALYLLNIKEQHILSQVAVDHVLACTRTLVSDVLSGILEDVRASEPGTTVQVLENKIDSISGALFKRLSSAALQRKYFKEHFNIVVSNDVHSIFNILKALCPIGTCAHIAQKNPFMEKEKSWTACCRSKGYISIYSTIGFSEGNSSIHTIQCSVC